MSARSARLAISILRLPNLLLSLLLFLAGLATADAQSLLKGTLEGVVQDAGGAAVPGAQVVLSPLNIKTVSDGQGDFRVAEIPAGKYTVTVSYVGFSPVTQDIDVTAGQPTHATLQLKVANASEQILVEASRPHGEAESINETRTADNLLAVMPSEVIRSLPNANVADATGRFPGVTLYRIEGEGVYIQVRGTEPRLTNVTVDGITIPAPEPTVRQVRLDVIPSDMVDAIQMNKTLLANMDGNGIGASVNLRTKEAGERPTLDLYGDGGYTPIMNGRGQYDFGGTVGKRFGASKRLGVLFNSVYDYNGRGIDNIQPKLDPLSTNATPFYDNDTIREYRYYRTRYGFDGSVDYRLSAASSVYARGFFSDLQDYGDKWYYSPVSKALACSSTAAGACGVGGAGTITAPSGTAASSAPKFYTSNKRPNAAVGTLIAGGRSVFSNSLLTYQVSASRAYEQDSAGNPKADFSWVGPTQYCNYVPSQQVDKLHPHFGNCDNTASSPLLSASNWQFTDITTSTGINTQLNLTAQASYAKSYRWWEHSGTWEMGFKFANDHQTQDATENVYDGFSNAPLMTSLLDSFTNTDYYNGTYFGGHYGQVSNFSAAQAYTLANFKGNLDGQKTALDTYPNLFHTVEQITAGYLMNAIDFGKLHINTGVRIEATRDMTFGYVVNFYGKSGTAATACSSNPNPPNPVPTTTGCYTFSGVQNNPGYVDVLPSVQFRYGLNNDSSLRAVYSRGVARPDPYQLVPYITEDSTASPVSVLIGNPNLRPEHANNYDLLYEYYLHPLGLVQAGFFFKQLTAPQVQVTLPGGLNVANFPAGYFPTTVQQALAQYPGDAITQYTNGQNAYIYGFELNFQQHFSYLPGVLRGLGVQANYSYTASQEKGLPLRSDHPTTIDQSPNTWKVSPTFDTKRFSARVGLAYDQASLFSYNYTSPTYVAGSDPSGLGPSGPSGDVWTLTHFQVDAQASYRFWKGFRAVVSGLNLNNEVFGYYTGNTNFVNQREYYKPTYSGGIRYSFSSAR
ncbi:TonB-dependent receptor [Bryocella elongata]|uniref:TonB-dependent receptor n=1 Tax=Bryocella elongata TaxID=863522 RepID=A0A1H6CGG9_9BACT|nr:TonB-dependent receptor [Bryocella elongata]SEG72110.1 TonB-dependent receptor [Bryocella elongata]